MRASRSSPVVAALVLVLALAPAARADAPPVVRRVLSNGVTVLVRETRAAQVVAVSLQVPGGPAEEPADRAGITNVLQRAMVRATVRRPVARLADAVEEIGGVLEGVADVEHAEIRAQALARHWQALLALVAEVAIEPALTEPDVEQARRLALSQIRTRAETPLSTATDAVLADLYGPHPYGRPTAGRAETVTAITRADLVTHHRRLYRPERLVLAVSGAVTADRVVKEADRLFRRLKREAPAAAAAAPPAPVASAGRRTLTRPAHQAQILMAYQGPSLADADYPAVKVLAAVIGRGTSSRLFREVRERLGLAYVIGVLDPYRRGPGPLLAYVGTAPATVADAEAALRRELARASDVPPTADEVERAKAFVLGTLLMDRRTNARQAWYLAFFERAGVGWDFPDRYARAVGRVTAADVAEAARRYLARPTTLVLVPGAS